MTPRKAAASRHGANVRKPESDSYVLESQVGFILRQVSQRHAVIFNELIGEGITPTQWAALSKLQEIGPTSQNLLGRLTCMDAATIKGVVLRLSKRHLVGTLKTHRMPSAESAASRDAPRRAFGKQLWTAVLTGKISASSSNIF